MDTICSQCSKNVYRITTNYLNNREGILDIEELYTDDDMDSIGQNMIVLYKIYNYFNSIYNNLYFVFSDKILVCNTCRENKNLDDVKKQNFEYIYSAFIAHMYNKIIQTEYLKILHKHISILMNHKYYRFYKNNIGGSILTILHDDLTRFSKSFKVKSNYWKGADYYYLKIFGVPRVLMELDNPNLRTHYLSRREDFSDSICGHPKASHGWWTESLNNLIEMGAVSVE